MSHMINPLAASWVRTEISIRLALTPLEVLVGAAVFFLGHHVPFPCPHFTLYAIGPIVDVSFQEFNCDATKPVQIMETSDQLALVGQYKHPAPHADSGVVGNDANLDKSKIEPLEGNISKGGQQASGLGDEEVDATRVQPLGGVREEY